MVLKSFVFLLLAFAILFSSADALRAQDDDEDFWARRLQTEVEVDNPVYKPVVSFGAGVLHFLGDIKNPGNNPIIGEFGYRGNVSTFVGNNNYFKLNFFFMYGNLRGHDFEVSRAMQSDINNLTRDNDNNLIYHNSSFRTSFFEMGANLEYSFGHWIGMFRRFKPFVSLGVSPIQFTPKGNILNEQGGYYHFWSDGTMRTLPEYDPNAFNAQLTSFDSEYDKDLLRNDYHGLGRYSQTTVVIPVEAGFDFYLSYRVNLRIATSLHYAFTDLLDNYNQTVAKKYGLTANGGNDMFMFTNFSLNFDLFSDPEMMRIDMYFAEIDFDYDVMFADQDGDGVYDLFDDCPDTPIGVEVDTLGCPFDIDGDGIPDFMDDEPNTPSGAIVDDSGVQLTPERLAQMFSNEGAVRREEAKVIPVAPIWTRSITFAPGVIPSKFRDVDKDGDGFISFEELLKAVEQFFDGKLNFTIEEIYELNNFFFSQ